MSSVFRIRCAGEAVHAFVLLSEGSNSSEELRQELQTHVKSRLAFLPVPEGDHVHRQLAAHHYRQDSPT